MNSRAHTVTPELLPRQDHRWMAHAACARRLDLPWTEDAHRVEAEIRDVMARVCTGCPVSRSCRRYANRTYASAGFWDGDFRGGAYTGDLLDLLADLDDEEVDAHFEPHARRARYVHRQALAS